MQAFDNSDKAADYIPSTIPFVEPEAARQNTHEPGGAYPDAQDGEYLRE